jgi:hypothetical protein
VSDGLEISIFVAPAQWAHCRERQQEVLKSAASSAQILHRDFAIA